MFSIFPVKPIAVANGVGSADGVQGDLPVGYKTYLLQATGQNTAGSITLYGTIDMDTAMGHANEWVELPAPSTEAAYQWSNPVTKTQPGKAVLAVDKPFIAFRGVSSADFNGTLVIQVLAAP